ncbi:MAG: hypothetical protein QOG28_6947 [Trebonia sp.]|nr:hypothetical protein [Trebonia sp.]
MPSDTVSSWRTPCRRRSLRSPRTWCGGCWPGSTPTWPGCRSSRSPTGGTTRSSGSGTGWSSGCRGVLSARASWSTSSAGCLRWRPGCRCPSRCRCGPGCRGRGTPGGGASWSSCRVRPPRTPRRSTLGWRRRTLAASSARCTWRRRRMRRPTRTGGCRWLSAPTASRRTWRPWPNESIATRCWPPGMPRWRFPHGTVPPCGCTATRTRPTFSCATAGSAACSTSVTSPRATPRATCHLPGCCCPLPATACFARPTPRRATG